MMQSVYAVYYKINQLEKIQDFICALTQHTHVPPEIIEFISPSNSKDRCAARMQCPCNDVPQQKNPNPGQAKSQRPYLEISLGVKRDVPATQR